MGVKLASREGSVTFPMKMAVHEFHEASAPQTKTITKQSFFRCKKGNCSEVGSRGLAYLSTTDHVSRLNCWVRNGSRCFPTAMAAITQSQGPDLNRSVVDLQSTA
jgi:hypothetical protein